VPKVIVGRRHIGSHLSHSCDSHFLNAVFGDGEDLVGIEKLSE
jgi:hypothetical protein